MKLNKEEFRKVIYTLKETVLKNEHLAHIYSKDHFNQFSRWISDYHGAVFLFLLC